MPNSCPPPPPTTPTHHHLSHTVPNADDVACAWWLGVSTKVRGSERYGEAHRLLALQLGAGSGVGVGAIRLANVPDTDRPFAVLEGTLFVLGLIRASVYTR